MKLTQLSVLSAAVMLASAAQANSFVDDSSLNIELRNFFNERSKEQKNSYDDSSSQWAQAIRADYSSGYFENIVGIDINAYYALKLGASNIDSNANPGVLPVDSKGDSSSFGKTGYAIKFNLMDSGVAKYGRMQLDTPLINDSDSRALPSMTEAFYADYNYEGLSVFGVWATKANAKTRAGYDKYQTPKTPADIDADDPAYNSEPVQSVGGAYDFGNGLALNAAYAQQKDFAKRYLTEVTYETSAVEGILIDAAAQYASSSTDGVWEKASKADSLDTKQKAWGLKVGAGFGAATVGLAYTKVDDSSYRESGKFSSGWASDSDDTGYFGYNAVQYSDFNARGQKAIGLNAGYDFADIVDGLSVNAVYVTSDYKDNNKNKLDEKEYNIKVTYEFPQVQGLSAQLRYARNTAEQSDDAKDVVVKDTRFIVKYNIAVF